MNLKSQFQFLHIVVLPHCSRESPKTSAFTTALPSFWAKAHVASELRREGEATQKRVLKNKVQKIKTVPSVHLCPVSFQRSFYLLMGTETERKGKEF